jgi:hypothetical protein
MAQNRLRTCRQTDDAMNDNTCTVHGDVTGDMEEIRKSFENCKLSGSHCSVHNDSAFFGCSAMSNSKYSPTFRKSVGQGWRTYGTRDQNGRREDFLGTRHSVLSYLSIILPDQRLCFVKNMCICIYTSLTVQTVYVYIHLWLYRLYVYIHLWRRTDCISITVATN